MAVMLCIGGKLDGEWRDTGRHSTHGDCIVFTVLPLPNVMEGPQLGTQEIAYENIAYENIAYQVHEFRDGKGGDPVKLLAERDSSSISVLRLLIDGYRAASA